MSLAESRRSKGQEGARAPSVHTLLVEAYYRSEPAESFLFPDLRAFKRSGKRGGRTVTKWSRLRPMVPSELRSLCTANGVPYCTSGSKGTGDPITSAHNNLHTLVNGRRHVNKKTGKGQDPSPTIARLLAAPLTPAEAAELHARAVAHHRATTPPLSSSASQEIHVYTSPGGITGFDDTSASETESGTTMLGSETESTELGSDSGSTPPSTDAVVACPGCGGRFQAECEAARCAVRLFGANDNGSDELNLPWVFGANDNDSDGFAASPSDNPSDDVALEATSSNGWWPESPSVDSDLEDVADFLSGSESSPLSESQAEECSQPWGSAYAALAAVYSPSAAAVSGCVEDSLFGKCAVRMNHSHRT